MVECFENDHKVNSKCFICNSIIVLLRDDLNTVYISQKIQREKFDVSQKPLIQKMHTEPEILNWMVGGVICHSDLLFVIRLLARSYPVHKDGPKSSKPSVSSAISFGRVHGRGIPS